MAAGLRQDVVAQPQLLVTDRKRLQGRMETLAMHGRRVELPSRLPPPEEVAALPKDVRRKQTLSVLAPNAAGKGLRSPPWHLEWLLAPSVKSVPLAFLVNAKKAQWQRWAPRKALQSSAGAYVTVIMCDLVSGT